MLVDRRRGRPGNLASGKLRKFTAMQDDHDRLAQFLVSAVAMLLVIAVGSIRLLPRECAIAAVSWAMLSVSAAISFGHFVLNEP
jgi:hypothetical protein